MYSPRTKLETPSVFDFPYTPYDIQQQLMQSVYSVLEQKGIGIFESPTGTGKSLTLTCSTLRWLLDHEELVRQDLQSHIDELSSEIKQLAEDDAKASDWISAQHKTAERRQELSELRRLSSLQQAFELKLIEMRERRLELDLKKQHLSAIKRVAQAADLEEATDADNFDELQLLDLEEETDIKQVADGEDLPSSEEIYKDVKIFFCSRTHSQLAQVVREVKRTTYGERIRCVSLASRQQLCINPQIRRLHSVSLINERCLDLASKKITSKVNTCDTNGCTQKKSRLSNARCCFKAPTAMQELSEASLLKILDIEDLVLAGESVKACPYYAARQATPYAQLIMLPYQLLLHRKTRLQSGIDLHNSVIIIDEAHNLLDTIAQIHSAEISLQQLLLVQQQLTAYKMRYASQLSTANLLKINQLAFIVKRLIKLLSPAEAAAGPQTRMLRTHELMSEGEFYNINIFHILEFCERTRFAQKLQGFALRNQKEPKPSENQEPAEDAGALVLLKRLQQEHMQRQCKRKQTLNKPDELTLEADEGTEALGQRLQPSVIRPLLAFLETLTECAEDGRVLISLDAASDVKSSSLKYVLLNPGEHFKEIVQQARAIIIAGGTLQPTAELTDQLFKSCPERLVQKFYDHVVPADSVLPFVVAKGPTGKRFCFNFAQRSNPEMLSELGMTLQNLCNVIPAGVVCFFPSYDFLETVYAHLDKHRFLERISQKKRIFREPRSSMYGQTVEQLLTEFAATIKRQESHGALLLSVVGGKLSEGLNFADDLGRCVIVVGMPYPNRNSPELQERMKYLDITLEQGAGSEYYENLCMKAVNQCIGRSVRHIRDYASVMLVDERYGSERVQRKLPQWIARSLQMPTNFGMIQGATARFFKQKKLV